MEQSDYEAVRERNIAERNAFFAEFFRDLKAEKIAFNALNAPVSLAPNLDEENSPPVKRRRINKKKNSNSPVQSWRSRSFLPYRKIYNTRHSSRNGTFANLTDKELNEPRLQVLFPWATPFERKLKLMVSDDYDEPHIRALKKQNEQKITRSEYNPDSIPSPDEITEEQMANIAEKSTNKIYSREHGTSCHQCRQKTLDTKTVCRSGQCIGVRGQFCGPCLRGRYGEDAASALQNDTWMCPPCRGLCNCSICRTRNGQKPTGILAPMVQEEGFDSVKDYLESAHG